LAERENDVAAAVTDTPPEEELHLCLFTIGEDVYAVPVELLLEIIIPQKIFPVPTTPPHVLGVINLRGSIVPIVDIRQVLSLERQAVLGQIAIIRYDNVTVGIVVSNVSEVLLVPENRVQPVSSDAGGGRGRFIQGLIPREAGAAALLNIGKILNEIKLT
jgi:chemotaxis signal transduction protein